LIHHHHPELIDFDGLDKNDRRGNTALAFEIAARELNIPVRNQKKYRSFTYLLI
jgi:hypothetical protein